jgi:putative transposase
VPEQVNVVMAELAADMREGLLALAVGTGLQVMCALMEEDLTMLAGPKASTTATGPRSGTAMNAAR